MTTYRYTGEAARSLYPNSEAEYYSDPSVGENPFSDADGVLTISTTPAAPGSNPYNLPYDSDLITTYGSFHQLYGYFEVRAELPAGTGLWPGFWLRQQNFLLQQGSHPQRRWGNFWVACAHPAESLLLRPGLDNIRSTQQRRPRDLVEGVATLPGNSRLGNSGSNGCSLGSRCSFNGARHSSKRNA
jgi:hypothetical protein